MSIIAMDDLEQQCWECNGKGTINDEECPKCDCKGYIATALGQTLLDFLKRHLDDVDLERRSVFIPLKGE